MAARQKSFKDIFGLFLNAVLIVSALGYFVDVFDLYLFTTVRTTSLKDLGLVGDAVTQAGLHLLNMQMLGMLLGGIFWGVLGDKKGRISVLFGSILLYSVANIANAFVHDVTAYALCRFVAGLGLAGELGAGITLVAESLPQNKRSLGTTFVASIGVAGGAAAALTGDLFPWRTTYMIGGFLGLGLLIARGMIYESQMFLKSKSASGIKRGRFIALFTNFKRFRNYLACVLIGVPVWYVVGILVTLSPEIALKIGVQEPIKTSIVIIVESMMITVGDVVAGLLSHFFRTRKKIVLIFLLSLALTMFVYFEFPPVTAIGFYILYAFLGFFIGTWCVLMTMAAELFGTNLRATVTSTVPNIIRGSTILLNLAVGGLGFMGFLGAIKTVGIVVIVLAILSILALPETYHRELDFNEKL